MVAVFIPAFAGAPVVGREGGVTKDVAMAGTIRATEDDQDKYNSEDSKPAHWRHLWHRNTLPGTREFRNQPRKGSFGAKEDVC
jgi:hypothetical protein